MATMKPVPPGGKVITQAQFNKAINVFGERVANVVKTLEERQDAFEDHVRVALLAIEDETDRRVAAALDAERERVWYRRLWRRVQRFPL
jgi:hypothetical protein